MVLHSESKAKSLYLNLRDILLSALAPLLKGGTESVPPDSQIHKILFIRVDRIGDLVLSTPALKSIKDKYPLCELTVLASSSNAPVISPNPHVDRVHIVDRACGWKEWIRTIKKLRAGSYDLAVDPYQDYSLKTSVITFLSGARFKIGYESYGRGIFYNATVPECKKPCHLVDTVLNVLKPLGIETSDRLPEMYLLDEEKKGAQDWIKKNRLGSNRILGVHPGAFYPTQRWPAEYYSELIRRIQNEGKHDLILFGGPGDTLIIEDILSRLDQKPVLCTGGGLRRFAALLSRCTMLICNNSGPLHLASALGIPTVSFMGPTVQETWHPLGRGHKVLRMDSLPCIGCNSGICLIRTHDCMRLLTPSMAMKEIMRSDAGDTGEITHSDIGS